MFEWSRQDLFWAPRNRPRRRHSACGTGSSQADPFKVSSTSRAVLSSSLDADENANRVQGYEAGTLTEPKTFTRSAGTSCMGGKPSLTVSRRCRHSPIAPWSQVYLGYSSRMSLQSSCAAWDRGVRVRCTIRALECQGGHLTIPVTQRCVFGAL